MMLFSRVKRPIEAIVKGENIPEPGIPESFKVLIKELQSLCLDAKIYTEEEKELMIVEDDDFDSAAKKLGLDLELTLDDNSSDARIEDYDDEDE